MGADHRDGEPVGVDLGGGAVLELSRESVRAIARAVAVDLREDLNELAEHRGLVLEAAASAKATLAELRVARQALDDAGADVNRLVRRGEVMAEHVDRLLQHVDAQTLAAAQTRLRVPAAAAGTAGLVAVLAEIIVRAVKD